MTTIEFSSQLISLEHSMMKFAYHFNLKKADAKDLVQDTYLKVLTRRDRYIDNENFKAWTFAIMKNIFVDNHRRSFRRNIYNDQTAESVFINQAEISGSDDPDSTYAASEITQNIDQLKNKLRIPFKMYVNGYKYSEIADELKMNIGTVKSRIFLSRKQLMGQLER
jgi:RNA polymerase sigma-70 factor (ECF subfamily)